MTAGLDSIHSMTDFDKAAETGEIDHERARKERHDQANAKMSKKIQNFARVSLHLGKQCHLSDNAKLAGLESVQEEAKS